MRHAFREDASGGFIFREFSPGSERQSLCSKALHPAIAENQGRVGKFRYNRPPVFDDDAA